MKPDDPLHEALSSLAVAAPDPVARDRALYHATVALRASRLASPADGRRWTAFLAATRWKLAGGTAALVLLAALGAALLIHRPGGERLATVGDERTLLSQAEILFGPQLDALVERPGSGADIRLSADVAGPVRPSLAQPVLIQFRRAGGGTTRVLSYSGRTVCVTLGEQRLCFEPLVTGRGEVILSGETFCWTPGQPAGGPDGYQVSTRLLPHS